MRFLQKKKLTLVNKYNFHITILERAIDSVRDAWRKYRPLLSDFICNSNVHTFYHRELWLEVIDNRKVKLSSSTCINLKRVSGQKMHKI